MASSVNIFSGSNASTISLLNTGRSSLFSNGIGLSANARNLTEDFISQNSSTANNLFSLSATLSLGDTDTIKTQILAIRASLPKTRLAATLQEDSGSVPDAFNQDNGAAAASDNGKSVDTTA